MGIEDDERRTAVSLSAGEQETIVRFSDDPNEAMTVYTTRRGAARRLIEAGATLIRTDVFGSRLEMPRSWFRWPRPPRVASDAQLAVAKRAREAAAARFQSSPEAPERSETPLPLPTGEEESDQLDSRAEASISKSNGSES